MQNSIVIAVSILVTLIKQTGKANQNVGRYKYSVLHEKNIYINISIEWRYMVSSDSLSLALVVGASLV